MPTFTHSAGRSGKCLGVFGFIVAAVVVCLGLTPGRLSAAPEPAPVPIRWELTFDPGPLRVMTVNVDGAQAAYFYFTYKVINSTGEDLFFTPTFEMFTDDGDLIRSGRDVPEAVTAHILRRLRNPLMEDEIDIQDRLLQGPENAREGLVVWPVRNMRVDEIKVFVRGLSGETKTIQRPDTGEPVTLRKTLMLVHEVPGEIDPTSSRPLTRREDLTRWIMR